MLEISAALAAMRGAFDLTKVAIEARDDAKIKAALAEMASKLMDANMGALAMSETLRKLEAELRQAADRVLNLEKALKKREGNVLFEIRPGAFVYTFQPVGDDKTPPHYKCQVCFDAGKDAVMVMNLDGNYLGCPIDRTHGVTLSTKQYNAVPRRGGGWMST